MQAFVKSLTFVDANITWPKVDRNFWGTNFKSLYLKNLSTKSWKVVIIKTSVPQKFLAIVYQGLNCLTVACI